MLENAAMQHASLPACALLLDFCIQSSASMVETLRKILQ